MSSIRYKITLTPAGSKEDLLDKAQSTKNQLEEKLKTKLKPNQPLEQEEPVSLEEFLTIK